MKYLIYALVGLLILWSAGYLICDFHRRLRGKRGCGSGGCESCPHEFCRHRRKMYGELPSRGGDL